MAAKCYLALAGILTQFSSLHALEALDEATMSAVTGQAQGIRFTSEFDATTSSITYHDDNGYYRAVDANGISPDAGSVEFSQVNIKTPTNRPLVVDVVVGDFTPGGSVPSRKGLFFYNRDLPLDISIESIAINGKSLGSYGQGDFRIADGDAMVTRLFPGGADGEEGVTIDLEIPKSMSFETYYEDDGARFSSRVDFSDPRDPNAGGLTLRGLTFDLVSEGLKVGLPTTNGGNINVYNAAVDGDVLNSAAYRNIKLKGGHILVKNARNAGDVGMEFDLKLNAYAATDTGKTGETTSFDFVYLAGTVDDNYPNPTPDPNDPDADPSYVYEASVSFKLLEDLKVDGLRMNVDRERGLVMDFDRSGTEKRTVISTRLLAENITLQRSDQVKLPTDANYKRPVSLGTIDANINLTNHTYLQVEGH